jgi:hypothetical protein
VICGHGREKLMRRFEDTLEVELKFVPREAESAVVARLAQLFAPEYGFAKWPPCANLDIYLDTQDMFLYRADTPLRLRRWATPFKLKEGFSANFKCSPEADAALPTVRPGFWRREIKTILSESEAREVCSGAIIGETLQYAASRSALDGNGSSGLGPRIMIATQQSLYVLRPRLHVDQIALKRGKLSDLLLLTFERCTIQAMPADDRLRLLRNGMFDVDPGSEIVELYEAEIEIVAAPENFQHAISLYLRAYDAIRKSGAEMPTRSKYSAAVDALNLHRVAART